MASTEDAMKRVSMIFSLILVAALAAQCKSDDFQRISRDLTPDEQALVRADQGFGFNLFRQIVAQEGDKNVFVSPQSVALALAMTWNGAGGETREAMARAMEIAELTPDQVGEAYLGLVEILTHQDRKVDFRIANSIWYRRELPVEQSFIDTNMTWYDARVSGLDFNDPSAADTINAWVDESTNGKISEIVDSPIDPMLVMFLINAIYFKGKWSQEFDKDRTGEEPFHLPDGTQRTVSTMVQEAELGYAENAEVQAVDMGYGDAGFSMTVLLPREGVSVDDVVQGLDAGSWQALSGQIAEREIEIHMPSFKMEYELTLNDALIAMGMEPAFTAGVADFSGISAAGDLFISKVKHKTFVEVNEEGTEAAAVTSVEVGLTSVPPPPEVVRVDRPFLFLIRESHTGSIIFMGKIVDPPQG
jgi:serine protease inhibitor